MTRLARVLFLAGGQPGERGAAAEAAIEVAVMVLCLGLAVSFSMSILFGNDERAHLGYVEALLDGELPTVDTPILAGPGYEAAGVPYEGDPSTTGPRGDVWVANHPPLAYLVTLPMVWLSLALDSNVATSMALRVASSVAVAVGVLAVAAVADALVPGHPRRAVLVAAVAGLTPMVVAVAGLGQIDGACFAVATALLAVILRIVRSGPSAGRLAWMVALSTTAALTRVSLLPLVALGAVAWIVGSRHQLRWAVLGSAATALVPLGAAGWFYARNVDLYGDIAGAEHLQEKFGRTRRARRGSSSSGCAVGRHLAGDLGLVRLRSPRHGPHHRGLQPTRPRVEVGAGRPGRRRVRRRRAGPPGASAPPRAPRRGGLVDQPGVVGRLRDRAGLVRQRRGHAAPPACCRPMPSRPRWSSVGSPSSFRSAPRGLWSSGASSRSTWSSSTCFGTWLRGASRPTRSACLGGPARWWSWPWSARWRPRSPRSGPPPSTWTRRSLGPT